MEQRRLGKTGLMLSRLGFGGMRLPMKGDSVDLDRAVPLMHRAFDLGINVVDTSGPYCKGGSESAIGEAVASWKKSRIHLSTKNPHTDVKDEKGWWARLEASLKALRTDCIDLYSFHNLRRGRYETCIRPENGFFRFFRRAKEQGMIRHMGFSIHDTPDVIRRIVDEVPFEFVILQYNLLDRSREGLFPYLKEKGIGVMVMGPAAGGRLCVPLKALGARADVRPAEIAFRFVFSNPHVDVAFSGMESMEQIEENARISENAAEMSHAEERVLGEITEKTGKLHEIYCTGCGYCLPCRNDVNIPEIFKYLIWKKVYGLEKDAREAYATYGAEGFWIPGKKADTCEECGECMAKCPQNIDIMSQLKEAHRELT